MNAIAQIDFGSPIAAHAALLPPGHLQRTPTRSEAWKEEVLTTLRGVGTTAAFARGTQVFKEGDNASLIYRVISGAVALSHTDCRNRRCIVDFRLAGEFFGVVYRPEYTTNAEATCDSTLIAYRRGYIDNMCDALPSFRRSITTLLAQPVASRGETRLEMSQTARERIAAFLLDTAMRLEDSGEVRLPFSDRDVADRIDVPLELVVSNLCEFEAAGAIARTGAADLMLIDMARLHGLTLGRSAFAEALI
jgi:CRP/FNR family nitrogen fixation transcriptional regulator